MHEFLIATAWALDRAEPKRGTIDPRWYQGRGAFGGVVAAALLNACSTRVSDPLRIPRSLTVHFAASAEQGEVEISTELEREGNKVSHVRAKMTRDGRTVAFASATYAAPRAHSIEYDRVELPIAPPLSEAPPPMRHFLMPAFVEFFELRFCMGSMPFSGAKIPELGGYIRPAQPIIADASMIVAMLDAWPPGMLALADRPMGAASVDFTVHLFESFPLANAKADDHYLGRVRSSYAREGYCEELRQLWSLDGRYLGQCRQLVAMF